MGDAGSLKRRNPREMFTDSSFYSPKHHPSVADQVEMAHALSSSLYDDGNKRSKGQVSKCRLKKYRVSHPIIREISSCFVLGVPLPCLGSS